MADSQPPVSDSTRLHPAILSRTMNLPLVDRPRDKTSRSFGSLARAPRTIALLGLAGWLAISALVAGCVGFSERSHGFQVLNLSANTYTVRVAFADGTTQQGAVEPRANVYVGSLSDPARAIVLDEMCSSQIAAVAMSDVESHIVIDKDGVVTVSDYGVADAAARAASPSLPRTGWERYVPGPCQ